MAEFVLTPQIKQLALRSLQELKGETVFIVNKETSKPVKVNPNHNVTANGGLGPHARFRVRRTPHRHRLGPVVRFENVATGKFLAIKNGQLTVGGGGDHCEFIVEQAQAAVFLKKRHNPNARIGFNGNGQSVAANTLGNGDRGRFFIFDCDLVVPKPQHHHHPQPHAHHHPQTHQARKANAQAANKVATAVAQTQAQASFVLTPQIKALALRSLQELKGETVYIVNKETSKPIAVAPNGGVTALGNLGPHSQFRVKRGKHHHRLGPVVRFQNVATGLFLAIKSGAVTTGSGGEHCELIVEMAQQAVFLKKHHNPGARIGFNNNGTSVPANNLGDGNRGRFFIFDCAQVVGVQRAPVPVARPVVPAAATVQLVASPPQAGVRCIIKSAVTDLCLHAAGGHREEANLVLHGGVAFAISNPNSIFVLKATVHPSTFIIQGAAGPLSIHAFGGAKPNMPIKLHGDERYARSHDNSKFQFMQVRGTQNYILRVHHPSNLCIGSAQPGPPTPGVGLGLYGKMPIATLLTQFHFQFIRLP